MFFFRQSEISIKNMPIFLQRNSICITLIPFSWTVFNKSSRFLFNICHFSHTTLLCIQTRLFLSYSPLVILSAHRPFFFHQKFKFGFSAALPLSFVKQTDQKVLSALAQFFFSIQIANLIIFSENKKILARKSGEFFSLNLPIFFQ